MAAQRFNVEEVFWEAVQIGPAARPAFLAATCADSKLRRRVESLLKAHDTAGDFLDGPAFRPASLIDTKDDRVSDSGLQPAHQGLEFLAPCTTPDRLGLLAHHEILSILGRGGMGIVLRGVDVKLNRVVAIKVLAPVLAANAMARQRFLREAQAAAAVRHDHVVAIHAVDEWNGLPYLVMEYISGSTLQQKIDAGGALALAQILRIGMQIASGLAAAHAQGLVHRDIKPANILLENGIERVKITDFGLARSIDDARITQAGAVYGTPQYMSPEQAQGERVDQRSDLFSLGSVLYAMSTGRPPFRGDTGLAVLKRVRDDTPRPIREVNPDIPAALAQIVDKLHAKQPADRFTSASEVADLLERCLSELKRPTSAVQEPAVAKPPKAQQRLSRRRRWAVAMAAILVLLAGLGLTEATGVTNLQAIVIRLVSPDGTLIVEVDDPGVSVSIKDGELVITGVGAKEIRLKPGDYKLVTSKDGKPVRQELVTVTRKGRLVVRVSKEGRVVAVGSVPIKEAPPLAKAPFDAEQARQHQKAWAKYLGVPVTFTNKSGMKFRLIPPGEFTMGLTAADAEGWAKFGPYKDQGKLSVPAHPVRLTRPFYLAEREVRYGEFLDLMKREPGDAPKHQYNEPDGVLMSNCTWFDCIAFCNRLSEREGLTPAYQIAGKAVTVTPGATGYRLPTEAEWEFACRAGTTSLWYFGWTVQEARAMADRSGAEAQGYLRARTGAPNPFGLLGMYAGASEWVWDWHDHDYYRECADGGVAVDPQGPKSGRERNHRGGSGFGDAGGDLTGINSASRFPLDPKKPLVWAGFGRVALPIPAKGR